MSAEAEVEGATVLRMTVGTKILVWVVLGAAGGGLGVALPWLLERVAKWPIPFIEYLEFLASFESPIMVLGRPAVLALVGMVVAFFITYESAELAITDAEIHITEGEDTRIVTRAQVGGVYRKAGKVRIESPEGRVLFHDDVEGGAVAIERAFVSHGYPWESVSRIKKAGLR